jgi:hypothetical protein
MRTAEFVRRRARIEHASRGRRYRVEIRALLKRSRAVPIIAYGRIVGYRLSDDGVACVKQRFRSEASAVAELVSIRQTANNSYIPVRAYECEWCHGWHLTSQPSLDGLRA